MYSTGLAYLLWLFSGFGVLGFHRFYLGKIVTGLVWMCTGGLCGVGALYDFLTLGRQVREANYRAAIATGAAAGAAFGSSFNRGPFSGTSGNSAPWRTVQDGETRIVSEKKPKKERPEKAILSLAKRNKGIITPAELALETDMPIDEAKKELEALVTKGYAELRVRQSGTIVYTIPEFMDTDSPLEF